MRLNPTALQVIRERSGLSVTDAATDAGISVAHLINVEAGRRNVSPSTAAAIAKTLKVPLAAILADPADADTDDEPVAVAS